MSIAVILLSVLLPSSLQAAQPVFIPAAKSPDHCETAVKAIAGEWTQCKVQNLKSDSTEARPAVDLEELEKALAAKPIVIQAKVNAQLKIGNKTFQQKTASLVLPELSSGEVIWFGRDNFAAPKNDLTKKNGFHVDHKLKELSCVADGTAYRYQGVEKADGSRKFVALYKGVRDGKPLLYVAGNTHNGMTQFALLCESFRAKP